jgi:hypothetical protein
MKRVVLLVAASLVVGCTASPAGSSAPSVPSGSASPSAPRTSPPSPSPSPSATGPEIRRIELSGRGPIGIALDGDVAWIVAPDSGHLVSVDLEAGRELASYEIGTAGTHLVVGDGPVFVARFDTGRAGEHLTIVRPDDGEISGIETGPLGGLAPAGDGRLWALEKAGAILLVDPGGRRVVDRLAVGIGQNEHIEVVAGADSAWVGSDNTRVWRVNGPDLEIAAELDVGGGIPLVFRDGLVWGGRADELWAIDPTTNEVSRQVPLTGLIEILALDIADGEAWIAARRPGYVGTVIALDLASGTILSEFDVSLPAGVAITPTEVWVTNAQSNELLGLPR